MDLKQARTKIDEVDQQLLQLFIQRMQAVEQVAAYKKENNLPIFNSTREEEIISAMAAKSPSHIAEYVKSFFTNLMEISKCYQVGLINTSPSLPYIAGKCEDTEQTTVAAPGTVGAYSEIATKKLFTHAQIQHYRTFPMVFDAVSKGEMEYGVVPIENSTAGSVTDVYDLLNEHDLFINQVYNLKVEHCLAVRKGLSLAEIKAVYSHKQAISQCSDFLEEHPDIEPNLYANTSLAAKLVSQSTEPIAAICSQECAESFGLEILRRNIQNLSENYTKFIVVSKRLLFCESCNEISICLRFPNRTGELNKMLTKFHLYSINMSKIESRPIGDKDFSVLFYINFEGNFQDKNVMELLNDLNMNCEYFKVTGCYEHP